MSSNFPLIRRSHRILPFLSCMVAGGGGRKLEINIPPQQIYGNNKGGLIIKGGGMSGGYVNCSKSNMPV